MQLSAMSEYRHGSNYVDTRLLSCLHSDIADNCMTDKVYSTDGGMYSYHSVLLISSCLSSSGCKGQSRQQAVWAGGSAQGP